MRFFAFVILALFWSACGPGQPNPTWPPPVGAYCWCKNPEAPNAEHCVCFLREEWEAMGIEIPEGAEPFELEEDDHAL